MGEGIRTRGRRINKWRGGVMMKRDKREWRRVLGKRRRERERSTGSESALPTPTIHTQTHTRSSLVP
jgi:hypothetical protein